MEVLRTARLRLRWFVEADAPFMLGLLNEPAWIENIYDPEVRSEAQAAAWIRDRLLRRYWLLGYGFWAVERLEDGETVGLCGVIKRDGLDHPDIGYGFPARFWGQGYAREAAAGTFEHCRSALGMRDVVGTTGPENHASGRVLLAIGMTDQGLEQTAAHEGLSRVYTWHDDQIVSDGAQIDALRARWREALSGGATASLSACLPADQAQALTADREDLSPAAYAAIAQSWTPWADDASLPAERTPLGWRLRLPQDVLARAPR